MSNQISMVAIVAILAAMGLIGAVVVQSIVIPQMAFADCPKHGSGWDNAKKNCNKPPRND